MTTHIGDACLNVVMAGDDEVDVTSQRRTGRWARRARLFASEGSALPVHDEPG